MTSPTAAHDHPAAAHDHTDLEGFARLADRIAAAAEGCAGVAGVWHGPVGTYLPHRTVPGVTVHDSTVTVSVVARYGHRLVAVADEVRTAVRRVTPERRVDVQIEDIDAPHP